MDFGSHNSMPADVEDEEVEIEGEIATMDLTEHGVIQEENPLAPAVGMEFESYEDVYIFYSFYAKGQGFGVRVSNNWYNKSKERYRSKLSCSSAGFKKKSDAQHPRPQTRTGCPAMIKFKLMDNKRWRIVEVELEHNHLISPSSGRSCESENINSPGSKRSFEQASNQAHDKRRLFRTVIVDNGTDGNTGGGDGDTSTGLNQCAHLKFQEGDADAIHSFFGRLQLMNPNFFYLMDVNGRGPVRNVFWTDVRSRVAYGYFSDVISIDTSCLTDRYRVPLVIFLGINHHGQHILLGCGLVAGETTESFVWLFRAWLTCMLGQSPQVVISDHLKYLQASVADVFPRASHCYSLPHIMQKSEEKLGQLQQYEAIREQFFRAVYSSAQADEFEVAWREMMQRNGVQEHPWLNTLYEDRKQWVPAFLKEISMAGAFPTRQGENVSQFFGRYLHKDTALKEFLEKYDQALQTSYQEEASADVESRTATMVPNSRIHFGSQLSEIYTSNIFRRLQTEVEGMCSCNGPREKSVDGPIVKYTVNVEGSLNEEKNYEVVYNTDEREVQCMCGLFNLKGYLCRHALLALKHNNVEEVPSQYILSRWRKDVKRSYSPSNYSSGIDVDNPIHRFDTLFKYIVQVVDEGKKGQSRYKAALPALDEILNRVRQLDIVKEHPS